MQITVRSRLTRQILLRPVQPTLTKKLLNFDVYFIFKITNQHQASSLTICRFFQGSDSGWEEKFSGSKFFKSSTSEVSSTHQPVQQCLIFSRSRQNFFLVRMSITKERRRHFGVASFDVAFIVFALLVVCLLSLEVVQAKEVGLLAGECCRLVKDNVHFNLTLTEVTLEGSL